MSLVRMPEVEAWSRVGRAREGEPRRYDERIIVLTGPCIGLRQRRGHVRLVPIGPGHEQNGRGAMPTHRLAMAGEEIARDRRQRGVDGALAAIHQHRNIEQALQFVEDNVVLCVERERANGVGPEVGLHIMPVQPRAADAHEGRAPGSGGRGGRDQLGEVVVDPVVVVEKAVADENGGRGVRHAAAVAPGHDALLVSGVMEHSACASPQYLNEITSPFCAPLVEMQMGERYSGARNFVPGISSRIFRNRGSRPRSSHVPKLAS